MKNWRQLLSPVMQKLIVLFLPSFGEHLRTKTSWCLACPIKKNCLFSRSIWRSKVITIPGSQLLTSQKVFTRFRSNLVEIISACCFHQVSAGALPLSIFVDSRGSWKSENIQRNREEWGAGKDTWGGQDRYRRKLRKENLQICKEEGLVVIWDCGERAAVLKKWREEWD